MPVGNDTLSYRRDLPHLAKSGKTYFITFCTRDRQLLRSKERDAVFRCCVRDHREAFWLHGLVVMPDHVHLLLTPYDNFRLEQIMQRMKSVSAHDIRHSTGGGGPVWQREYFDRILRSNEDLKRKADSICENPVRAGIVSAVDDYPWIWRCWTDDAPARAPAPH
jgi:putative transposase